MSEISQEELNERVALLIQITSYSAESKISGISNSPRKAGKFY